MKKSVLFAWALLVPAIAMIQCSSPEKSTSADQEKEEHQHDKTLAAFGGFGSAEKYGEHLVTVCGCNDCHTPKKMTDHGPEPDSSLWLSGHPAKMPAPPIAQAELAKKGLAATDMLTAWVGPWGTTFAPNLTSDETGVGNWTESQFITCIREGKLKGTSRGLLPPMPWQFYKAMTDDELKAIFAYLKSTKPIENVAPAYLPPSK